MADPIIYRCPNTGLNVQSYIEAAAEPGESYQSVTCSACTRIHFVHAKTGKLLGESQTQL